MEDDDTNDTSTSALIWLFRVAIGLYVAAVAALVMGAIAVSVEEVPVSAYVQSAERLRPGQPNAIRGLVLDGETGRYLVGSRVNLDQGGETFAEGETEPHGYVHLQFDPQGVKSGPVLFEARHGRLEEPYSVEATIDVAEPRPWRWPTTTPRRTNPWTPNLGEWEGDLRVDLFPKTDVVRGLPDRVVLRATEAESGAPVAAEITIDKIEGLLGAEIPTTHTTDALGLVTIELEATTRQLWTVSVRRLSDPIAPPSKGKVGFDTAPAQYSLRLMTPYVVPGREVTGEVHSLHRSGGVMVDLYEPDDWASASAFGIGKGASGIRVAVPEVPRTPLYRVQVYGNVFGVETAWDSDYVAAAPEAGLTGCRVALEQVLEALAENDPERWKDWVEAAREPLAEIRRVSRCAATLEAVLLAVPREFTAPQPLINSQQAEREELEAYQAEVRAKLVFLLTLVLLGGLAIVAFLVLRGVAASRRQRAAIDAATADLDDDEWEPVDGRFEEYLDYARIAIILVSLVAFVLALLMVLEGL